MTNEQRQDARLTAVAIVRAILNDDGPAYHLLLDTTTDLRDLAQACAGLAATMMAVLPDEFATRALDAFTTAGLDE